MIDVGVFDQEFAHYPHVSLIAPQQIRWHKNEELPVTVFTDRTLNLAADAKCQRKIAWIMEPREYRPEPYEFIEKSFIDFDYVITHDLRLMRKCGTKGLFCNASATTWMLDQDQGIHPKTKLMSMITSGKMATEGHQLRESVADVTEHFIDVFGPRRAHQLAPLYGKIDALRDYQFTIIVLNSDANCFFTEALIDAFRTGTIPIFWGTREITYHFHPNGILRFEDLEGLEKLLQYISPDLYQHRLDAVRVNFEIASQYRAPEDWLVSRYPFLFDL